MRIRTFLFITALLVMVFGSTVCLFAVCGQGGCDPGYANTAYPGIYSRYPYAGNYKYQPTNNMYGPYGTGGSNYAYPSNNNMYGGYGTQPYSYNVNPSSSYMYGNYGSYPNSYGNTMYGRGYGNYPYSNYGYQAGNNMYGRGYGNYPYSNYGYQTGNNMYGRGYGNYPSSNYGYQTGNNMYGRYGNTNPYNTNRSNGYPYGSGGMAGSRGY